MPERPPPDASAAELMEWFEADHAEAIADKARELGEDGVDVSATTDE